MRLRQISVLPAFIFAVVVNVVTKLARGSVIK